MREHAEKWHRYPAQQDKDFAWKTVQNAQRQIEKLKSEHPSLRTSDPADSWRPGVPATRCRGEVTMFLSNPGMPTDSLDQLTYELFTGTGLTILIHGPFDLSDLVAEVQRVIPFFAGSEALENGLAAHPTHLSAWVGMDGPTGSAVAVFVHPDDSAYFVRDVVGRLQELSPGFTSSMAHRGDIDKAASEYLDGAVSVPAWDFLHK